MKPADFRFLADENIHPRVIAFLHSRGFSVASVEECGLVGATDVQILRRAHSEGRVILTHDRDFARLAIIDGELFRGIIYLRPGHIDPQFTIETLTVVLSDVSLQDVPFIIFAQRFQQRVDIRVRTL